MSNGFFKHLRRIAPITKTKMVWNVNALKMNKNLTEGKNWKLLKSVYLLSIYLNYIKNESLFKL